MELADALDEIATLRQELVAVKDRARGLVTALAESRATADIAILDSDIDRQHRLYHDLLWEARRERDVARATSYLRDDGSHRYVSTACIHGRHGYCAASQREDGTTKTPATCKFGPEEPEPPERCECPDPACAHRAATDA